MIGVSQLLCQNPEEDSLRYHHSSGGRGVTHNRGPVVVWNITPQCNLACQHCYYHDQHHGDPCTLQEGNDLLKDLAASGVPVILFSGGEPLLSPHLLSWIHQATELGMRPTLSTNGTLIDRPMARLLKQEGVGYVGISIDGLADQHDGFRGVPGSFQKAIEGIEACQSQGQKVGLRLTLHAGNAKALPQILRMIREMKIPRLCLYHLVGQGKASQFEDILSPQETRTLMEEIFSWTEAQHRKGFMVQVLTVDNHADGVLLYLRQSQRDPAQAQWIYEQLGKQGGNRSGVAICAIDHTGEVHPDQFSQRLSYGNVKTAPFSELWNEPVNPDLARLRDRTPYLPSRCRRCSWLRICNGNLRARALAQTGQWWGEDAGCYLSPAEISSANK